MAKVTCLTKWTCNLRGLIPTYRYYSPLSTTFSYNACTEQDLQKIQSGEGTLMAVKRMGVTP